jgi:hypothetical protein
MKVCNNCKQKEHCAELPGICLKLPCILTGAIAVMVVVLMVNSTL